MTILSGDRVSLPTVEQLEAHVKDLQEQLMIARGFLSVARKADKRRQEGPLLPGLTGGRSDEAEEADMPQ